MRRTAKWVIRKAAEKLDVFDTADYPAVIRLGKFAYVKVPESQARDLDLPAVNPFIDEAGMVYRQETAMMLLDDDVFGFLLLLFRPERKQVDLRMQIEPEWMPLFQAAAAKVVQA